MPGLNIKRLVQLPMVLEPSTMYIVKGANSGEVSLVFTGESGEEVRRVIDPDQVASIVNTKLASWKPATATAADTAVKLKTARKIELTGAVTGSVTFDGSAAVAIATNVTNAPQRYKVHGTTSLNENNQAVITWLTFPIRLAGAKSSHWIPIDNGEFISVTGRILASGMKTDGTMFYGVYDIDDLIVGTTGVPTTISTKVTKGPTNQGADWGITLYKYAPTPATDTEPEYAGYVAYGFTFTTSIMPVGVKIRAEGELSVVRSYYMN